MPDKKTRIILTTLQSFLTQGGNLKELKAVATDIKYLLQRERKEHTVTITTAAPITETQKQMIEDQLKAVFGPGLEYDYQLDTSLLGGIKVQLKDQVFDLSMRNALEQLKQTLKQ